VYLVIASNKASSSTDPLGGGPKGQTMSLSFILVPNRLDKICIKTKFFEKEKANKFQGKPVKIVPRINSETPKRTENIIIKETLLNLVKYEKKYTGKP